MRNVTVKSNLYLGICMVAVFSFFTVFTAVPAAGQKSLKAGGTDGAYVIADSTLRDPFWPVGFQPKHAEVASTNEPQVMVEEEISTDWNKAMQEVAIQGVSSRAGNEFYAVINGEVKSKGDTVSVQAGNATFTWMIESISPPSSVKMRRVSVQ